MFVVWCRFCVGRCVLVVCRCWLWVVCRVLFRLGCVLFVHCGVGVCRSVCVLRVVCCLLIVVCWLLIIVCLVLLVVCRVLVVGCCVLAMKCSLLVVV